MNGGALLFVDSLTAQTKLLHLTASTPRFHGNFMDPRTPCFSSEQPNNRPLRSPNDQHFGPSSSLQFDILRPSNFLVNSARHQLELKPSKFWPKLQPKLFERQAQFSFVSSPSSGSAQDFQQAQAQSFFGLVKFLARPKFSRRSVIVAASQSSSCARLAVLHRYEASPSRWWQRWSGPSGWGG